MATGDVSVTFSIPVGGSPVVIASEEGGSSRDKPKGKALPKPTGRPG